MPPTKAPPPRVDDLPPAKASPPGPVERLEQSLTRENEAFWGRAALGHGASHEPPLGADSTVPPRDAMVQQPTMAPPPGGGEVTTKKPPALKPDAKAPPAGADKGQPPAKAPPVAILFGNTP